MSDRIAVSPNEASLAEAVNESYDRLLQVAKHLLQMEHREVGFDAGDLVHEAYLRLAHMHRPWEDRVHFVNLAAYFMRCVLCDRARRHCRLKRDPGCPILGVADLAVSGVPNPEETVDLTYRLKLLIASGGRCARVAELRIAGFTISEIAFALKISQRTAKRDWMRARAAFR